MQALIAHTSTTSAPPLFATVDMDGIEQLDFTMIKLKLQDSEEGPGWSPERCEEAQVSYMRFLALKRAYPDLDLVPNRDVDVFWHQHILDTAQYATDCDQVFGYFMHHYPYFGMNGADDHSSLVAAFDETAALYALHFSESWGDTAKNRAKCRTKCKPMKCK